MTQSINFRGLETVAKSTKVEYDFMYRAVDYVNTFEESMADIKVNQGLYTLASDERKELIRSFKVTNNMYSDMVDNKDASALRLLLDVIFECDKVYDSEMEKRFAELQNAVNSFTKLDDYFAYNVNNFGVTIALLAEGEFFRFRTSGKIVGINSSSGFLGVKYSDGKEEVLLDNYLLATGFRVADEIVSKSYARVLINGTYFRSHTLLTALRLGVGAVKNTLGRYSILTFDHINKNPNDNRAINLRVVTRSDNRTLAGNMDYDVFDFLDIMYIATLGIEGYGRKELVQAV